jgi:hypothetical protein
VEDVAEEILHVIFMICSGGLSSYRRQLNRHRFTQFLGRDYVTFNAPSALDAIRVRDHDLSVLGVVPDTLGQGENKFVMCERLCDELLFKILKLSCGWHLSAVLETFVFLR